MKKIFFLFVFFFGISSAFISCSSSDENTPEIESEEESIPLTDEVQQNVSYGENEQEVYDLYLPANRNSTKTKVLILVHGGGWTSGDKADMTQFITLIQTNHPNHAIVNMNYVLATTSIPAFPNQFLEIDKVINKLTAEKETLQILPEFGLIGTSAGAHLALQYDYAYDTDNQVKMVCDIVGPTDFTDPFYANDPNFNIALSLFVDESAYPNTTNYTEAVSPAFQVSTSSSPTIMFYGNQDPLVPLTNGERLDTKLSNAMIDHNFTIYPGGHGDNWSAASIADLQIQLSAFINTHLSIL